MSSIDANSESVAKAVTNDASATPTALLVDPVTGYLLVSLTSGTLGGVAPTKLTVDANSEQVSEAVTNDANATIRPIATTTEGYLLVEIS